MKHKLLLAIIVSVVAFGFLQQTGHSVSTSDDYSGQKLSMVLLGDSYSAGNGSNGFEFGPLNCHRNSENWAEKYKNWLHSQGVAVTFQNRACSGAKTADFLQERRIDVKKYALLTGMPLASDSQVRDHMSRHDVCGVKSNDEMRVHQEVVAIDRLVVPGAQHVSVDCQQTLRPQINNVDKSTDLVVMTVGGNDLDFDAIVKECFAKGYRTLSFLSSCKDTIDSARTKFKDLVDNTGDIFSSLRSRLRPDAKIVLLGYPLLALDNDIKHFGYPIAQEVRKLGIEGNNRQKIMVDSYNKSTGTDQVIFVDQVNNTFAGHEPDAAADRKNPNRWVNEFFEPSPTDMSGWYHPNPQGHEAYAQVLRRTIAPRQIVKPTAKSDIDVVFALDTTGSMERSLYQAKTNIVTIIQSIKSRAVSARFAFVTFQDHPTEGGGPDDYPSRLEVNFTEDSELVKSVVQAITLGYGGDWEESAYSGLKQALDLPWRAGVKKL